VEHLTEPVALIASIAEKNRDAFSRFYDLYAPMIYSLALRMLRASSEAEDLLQEIFLQVWRQAAAYSFERGTPEAWLINIARSRAIDKLRSMRRREKNLVLTDDPAAAESPDNVETSAGESETRLIMNSALANLPEAQRRVLELAYFDGLSQTEIAARLAEPLGTVKTRMRAGIQRLRGMLGTQAA
jgi:RNA polymerase sigma-70 factor (ECF subfamily)